MSRLAPLYAAVAIFPLLAAGATLPYVAYQYRRLGTLGAGHLLLAGAFALYLVGLAFAVILPLRPVTPDFCTIYGADVYLNPLRVLDEARYAYSAGGASGALTNSDVLDFFLNVALFIPLGLFVRHLLRRGFAATVAIGLGVSLLIELTQLTGNWGLYPCAYRYFATGDLLTNTAGAAIGAFLAPALRAIPAQAAAADPSKPRPISAQRRLLAAVCNLALIAAVGFALLAMSGLLLDATRGQLFASDSARAVGLRAVTLVLVPGAVVMLVIPLLWGGRTPGEWAVLIEPSQRSGAGPPSARSVCVRFALGPAPVVFLMALALIGVPLALVGAVALSGVQIVRILLKDDAILASGIRLDDSRRTPFARAESGATMPPAKSRSGGD